MLFLTTTSESEDANAMLPWRSRGVNFQSPLVVIIIERFAIQLADAKIDA